MSDEVVVEFSYGLVERASNDPHRLFGSVEICGVEYALHGWEVDADGERPHPAMAEDHRLQFYAVSATGGPSTASRVVTIDGLPGRWLLAVTP